MPKSELRGRAVEQAAEKMDVGKTAVAEVMAAEKAEPGTTEKIKKGQVTVAQVRKPKKAASNVPERKRHGHTAALELALRFERELYKMEYRLAKLDRDEITPAVNTD